MMSWFNLTSKEIKLNFVIPIIILLITGFISFVAGYNADQTRSEEQIKSLQDKTQNCDERVQALENILSTLDGKMDIIIDDVQVIKHNLMTEKQ